MRSKGDEKHKVGVTGGPGRHLCVRRKTESLITRRVYWGTGYGTRKDVSSETRS